MAPTTAYKRALDHKERETFRKRKKTLFKGCHMIEKACHSQVYLIICRKGKHISYVTERTEYWPPKDEFLAQVYPPLQEISSREWRRRNITGEKVLGKTERDVGIKESEEKLAYDDFFNTLVDDTARQLSPNASLEVFSEENEMLKSRHHILPHPKPLKLT